MSYDLSKEEFEAKAAEAIEAGRKSVVMFEDADGNWRGVMLKSGQHNFAREVGPETVLQVLLTHDGK